MFEYENLIAMHKTDSYLSLLFKIDDDEYQFSVAIYNILEDGSVIFCESYSFEDELSAREFLNS